MIKLYSKNVILTRYVLALAFIELIGDIFNQTNTVMIEIWFVAALLYLIESSMLRSSTRVKSYMTVIEHDAIGHLFIPALLLSVLIAVFLNVYAFLGFASKPSSSYLLFGLNEWELLLYTPHALCTIFSITFLFLQRYAFEAHLNYQIRLEQIYGHTPIDYNR